MLIVKIVICILTFVAIIIARGKFDCCTNRKTKIIARTIPVILGVIFCILIIVTKWNLFAIPKILLFISCCLWLVFVGDDDWGSLPFSGGILITIISYIVSGVLYFKNIREDETPDITVTKTSILCAKDNSVISGGMSGGIFYVQASVSEKSEYHYYYQQEDGGIKLGTIPADDTTIYYVGEDEGAYLETTVETRYTLNYNNNPATIWDETSETTYKLYVPEGSVTSVYEFDAE